MFKRFTFKLGRFHQKYNNEISTNNNMVPKNTKTRFQRFSPAPSVRSENEWVKRVETSTNALKTLNVTFINKAPGVNTKTPAGKRPPQQAPVGTAVSVLVSLDPGITGSHDGSAT
jgi:hypothetical protein